MALLSSSMSSFSSSLFSNKALSSAKTSESTSFFFFRKSYNRSLNFTSKFPSFQKPTFPSLIPHSSQLESAPEPDPNPTPNPTPDPNSNPSAAPLSITDEWGEKTEPEPEYPDANDADPPKDDDEWEEEYIGGVNGSAAAVVEKDDTLGYLKRALVDTVYGSDYGFRASREVRGEVSELVNQLEALNPIPAPVDATSYLDGNWILVYTAFSELLPLLAVGSIPLLKVEKISQSIDTSTLSIVNATTLSSPFASFSFSATASFEVRSASRIQVQFKESTLQPPEIKSAIDLPGNVNLFGQNISLPPVQQYLKPVRDLVASISRTISGQPPLKVPIPGERTKSWLLITFLDEDLRISRGDGGLFVLVKEGSPLLN